MLDAGYGEQVREAVLVGRIIISSLPLCTTGCMTASSTGPGRGKEEIIILTTNTASLTCSP